MTICAGRSNTCRDTRARRASGRELLILRCHLEASLLEDWTAPGWGRTRIVRRCDDYERVLARLEQAHADSGSEPGVR